MKKLILFIIATIFVFSVAMLFPVTTTAATTVTATPTNSKILIDGVETEFDAYLINGSNFFKLRDLAKALNGTEKQFEVTWNNQTKTINLISDAPYTSVGGELTKGDGIQKNARLRIPLIILDGKDMLLNAYNIDGNNYFKLRDVGKMMDFNITWDGVNKTVSIDTKNSYVGDYVASASEEDIDALIREYIRENKQTYDTEYDEFAFLGFDGSGQPIIATVEEFAYLNSEEYLLENGTSSARTSYEMSTDYIVSLERPSDSHRWTKVDFWWEPVRWQVPQYGASLYFEWDIFCSNSHFDGAKGNALEYIPECPDYEESYNLYKGGEFKFGLKECDKYGVTTLYVRRI